MNGDWLQVNNDLVANLPSGIIDDFNTSKDLKLLEQITAALNASLPLQDMRLYRGLTSVCCSSSVEEILENSSITRKTLIREDALKQGDILLIYNYPGSSHDR